MFIQTILTLIKLCKRQGDILPDKIEEYKSNLKGHLTMNSIQIILLINFPVKIDLSKLTNELQGQFKEERDLLKMSAKNDV